MVSEFVRRAHETPDRIAIALTRTGVRNTNTAESATFRQLHARAEAFAGGLHEAGLRPGDRLILANPLSVDFYALGLALVGSGMTLVLIDGRMDRRRLLGALRAARAEAIVSVASALRRWPLVPPLWRLRRYAVDDAPAGVRPLTGLATSAEPARLTDHDPEQLASISFTSGTSGRAKGVRRSYGILDGQHRSLSRHLPYRPDDVDMPAFPAVVLHNLCCGVTTVIPPVDLREPGSVDPAAVVAAAREHGVTTLSGAPAYISRIVEHMRSTRDALPAVRRVVVGGAPVSRRLAAAVLEAFPEADGRVVYGSTEAEPIAHVGMDELLAAEGEGFLVGAPVPELELELAELPARVEQELTPGEVSARVAPVGEVVVKGPSVSRDYVGDPDATALNKLRETGGDVWHRTGDIARRDAEGRLWLLGRRGRAVVHRGRTLQPLALEAAVTELPVVRAAALIAHAGAPEGELAVALDDDPGAGEAIRARLAAEGLETLPIRVLDSLPTDARHNSKVDRAALAELLERGL